MMRLFALTILLCLCRMVSAQTNSDTIVNKDEQVLTDSIPESYIQQLDYFYTTWHTARQDEGEYVDSAYIMATRSEAVVCPDSVYLSRLDSLNSAIRLSFNDIVRNYIELYTVRKRLQLATMLGLSEYYFPMFEEALAAECMPLELRYLPVIESALIPVARSHAGAAGLWQFIYGTGKMYKLEINSYIDERHDPAKATKAAVRYLNDLYSIYEDWILVIAAYNCGPGNVNKAIRRSGGKKNYWDIYYKLPKETRGYVPAFIGAMYAFNYYKEHKILPIENTLPNLCDTVIIDNALHFDQICKNIDMSVEELRDINPQYIKDIVPAGFGKSYALKMPYNYVGDFIDNQDTIFAYKRDTYFNNDDRVANPNDRFKKYAHVASSASGDKARLVYTVRSGDVPGAIASKFNVTLADLRYWNNLNRKNLIRVGQKLVVYVSDKNASRYKESTTYAGTITTKTTTPKVETVDGEFVYYTVKRGENLWGIAKKYPGVTNKDIMKWNGISEADVRDIKPGQKLKIKI